MKDSIVAIHLMMFTTKRAGIDTGKMKQLASGQDSRINLLMTIG
jgi:hypothetical protein